MRILDPRARRTALVSGALSLALTGAGLAQTDDCAAPTAAALGANPFDNSGATDSTMDGGGLPCALPGSVALPPAPGKDVFWTFTVPAAGTYQFDTLGSGFDTVLQLHDGSDCSATCRAHGDQYDTGNESVVRLEGLALGDALLIQAGTWGGGLGQAGVLNVTDITASVPAGDGCANPTLVGLGAHAWDNSLATLSGFEGGGAPCVAMDDNATPPGGAPEWDVFFLFTSPALDHYEFDTLGTGFDTILSLHDGADCSAVCLATDDDSASSVESRIVEYDVPLGASRLIQVGSWSEQTVGAGVLNIAVHVAAPNDGCAAPTPIGVGTTAFDNTLATTSGFDGGGLANCPTSGAFDQPKADLFYLFSPGAPGDYAVDTYGSVDAMGAGVDTVLSVHLGGDCSATCLRSSDWGNEVPGHSRVEILGAQVGDDYLIQVGAFLLVDDETATGALNVTALGPAPVGDDCAAPDVLVGTGAFAWDNTSATASFFDGASALCVGVTQGASLVPPVPMDEVPTRDLFWTWTPPADEDYVLDTAGSGVDTILNLYSGSDCSATCLAGDDDGKPDEASVVYVLGATTADTYLVQVGTWYHATTAAGVLNVEVLAPVPANDTCATPAAISGEQALDVDNSHPLLTTSGFDGGDPGTCMSSANAAPAADSAVVADLFFAWTPDCDGDYRIDTAGSPEVVDTKLAVHLGADCSATCLGSNDDVGGGDFLSELTVTGATASDTYLVQLGTWSDQDVRGAMRLNITNLAGPCSQNGIQIGCDPALDHFLGNYVKLDGSTFGNGVGTGLNLHAVDGPPTKFGFVIMAATPASIPVFQGLLCVGAPQGRYSPQIASNQGLPQLSSVGQFDAAGVFQNLVGTGTSTGGTGFDVPVELPFTPSGQTIQTGDVYHFQVWYRDEGVGGSSTANFSNTVIATFP